MSLSDKLTRYFPDAEWALDGETYAGLEWIGPGAPPTEAELDALAWPPIPDLATRKAELKAAIDAAAEAERLKYVTAGAGQSMTYQEKAAEAARLADDPSPDPADYPMLAAEIGITAATLADVAATVAANRAAWRTIGAAIEGARLGTKAAVDAAETVDDAEAAALVAWPAP
ncbi:hypothetical protein [Aurantimonas coralicida]|uniref:hypothetical protein n=1 Tax=Aurantimonas coralicida TaxID=182270 RepID=UPI001E4E90B3|nr:hypothetical protein [Aurantimonas coralicida]MCD1644332.1 hypothetical protein [Aurantimonas coralicida]